MTRSARIVIPGLPHHVTQRGGRRLRTFFEDADYRRYLELLSKAAAEVGLEVPVHCLMPNHVHLIAVPPTAGALATALRRAHRRYAEEVNTRFGWTGHLWQQRFGSSAMDERHARNALRYLVLNPVRAGLVQRPEEWPWSNASELFERPGPWQLGGVEIPAGPELRAWLEEPLPSRFGDELHRASRTGRPLGDDSFLDELEDRLGRSLRASPRGRPPRWAGRAAAPGSRSRDGSLEEAPSPALEA